MSFPFRYLIFLLLCVSPHACNSRYLGLQNKETKNELRLNVKDFLKQDEVPKKTVIMLKHMRRSIFEELQPEEKHMNKIRVDNSAEVMNNAIVITGTDHKVSSSLEASPEKTEIKGRKMQARSTMESKNQEDTDENIKSEENNGIVEDVVVMDYAQPHRKPPIHNL